MSMESRNYLVCVGGTGTRVLRAIIHNCAAGVIKDKEINVIVIDADQKSAAWDYIVSDYEKYQSMYELFRDNGGKNKEGCFKTKINFLADKNIISPVNYGECKKLRQSLYGDSNLERIMGWLYTKTEMDNDLEKGFFAKPNVGCVFFSHFENDIFNSFLDDIITHLENDKKVNIMLIGSIFGGTGASGLPTILKLIDKHINKNSNKVSKQVAHCLNVGAVFMMPYFTAKYADVKDPLIEIDNFNTAAKEALKYYKEEKYFETDEDHWTKSFQSLYLVKSQILDLVNVYAEGGKEQDNKPHIAEEYAALAVGDFLIKAAEMGSHRGKKTAINLYELDGKVGWNDLPVVLPGEESLKRKMGELTRFSVIYHNCMCTYMERQEKPKDSSEKSKVKKMPQWYVTFIPQQADENFVRMSGDANDYCRSYLKWISMIQEKLQMEGKDRTYQYDDKIQLFGEIITKIAGPESDAAQIVNNVNDIKDNFGKLICAGSEIGYALKEIFLILSKLGVEGALKTTFGKPLNGVDGVKSLVGSLYQLIK